MFKIEYSKLFDRFNLHYNIRGSWHTFVFRYAREAERFIYSGRFTDEEEEILIGMVHEELFE